MDKRITTVIVENNNRITPIQKKLIEHTNTIGKLPGKCGSQDVIQLLQLLMRVTNTRKIVEVGTLTGCTTIAMAMTLPEDGNVTTIDRDDKLISQVRHLWKEAGVENKVFRLIILY